MIEGQKYKLKHPVTVGSETVSELAVRAPKAKDMRAMPSNPGTGDLLNLAGKLCGQPPSVIDELSIPDMTGLLEIVGNFMEPGQETGSKPSGQ